jgi:opine dehydrogenase
MSTVAVLGAGGGGLSACVELTLAGWDVALWNRRPRTLSPYVEDRLIPYDGVLGSGTIQPGLITTDLSEAIAGASVVVICLPSLAHAEVFADLAELGVEVPLVLNPGHTGAALHARQVWASHGTRLPPLAEFSTLTYVARVGPDGTVGTTGRAKTIRVACLPGGEEALSWAQRLFDSARPVGDVLASSLSNANLVLHPPGAILGLAWVEATGGDFTFYVEGMTPGVAGVLSALDDERRAVAAGFGHELPTLLDEMTAIGTVESTLPPGTDVATAIRTGKANSTIKAPDSTSHRYYREDLPYGLLPFTILADIAGVPVPAAQALLQLGTTILGHDVMSSGLDRHRLGLEGASLDDLLAIVRS